MGAVDACAPCEEHENCGRAATMHGERRRGAVDAEAAEAEPAAACDGGGDARGAAEAHDGPMRGDEIASSLMKTGAQVLSRSPRACPDAVLALTTRAQVAFRRHLVDGGTRLAHARHPFGDG